MLRLLPFILTVLFVVFLSEKCNFIYAQGCGIAIDVTVEPNTGCLECDYSGPSIMINEVCLEPVLGDGSLFGLNSTGLTGEGEWIELYNPDWCNAVDISGYLLGSFNSNGDNFFPPVTSNAMAFSIPQGIIVPPLGFAVVRGSNAPVPPPGTIDIVVNNNNNGVCIGGGLPPQSRIWFQNSQGWFAFYDNNGVMQDAISWGVPAPASDYNQNPCVPPNNSLPAGATLSSYNAGGVGQNIGFSTWGMSFVRMPDGGNWSPTMVPENTSYGACNDANNCLTQSGFVTCNGTASVNVTAGNGPFTFQWDDPALQSSNTASNLCADDYQVVITDANGCSQTFNVTIVDDLFEISAVGINPTCGNADGSITVSVDPPGNHAFQWSSNTGITDTTTTTATALAAGTYNISVSEAGCIVDTTITLAAPDAITDVTAAIEHTTCNQENGTIEIEITGGTAPFQTFLNGTSTASNINFENLAGGSYTILVIDANDCDFEIENLIIEDSEGIAEVAISVLPEDCGEANGTIEVGNIVGGTPPYAIFIEGQEVTNGLNNLTAGIYDLVIIDEIECNWEESILVPQIGGGTITSIPNIFTPNGDGINDFWSIELDCIESYNCIITNRWGNVVYESKNHEQAWDGRDSNGQPVTDGVYFYNVNYQFIGEASPTNIHGFIHVKR